MSRATSDHPTWAEGIKFLRGLYDIKQTELAEAAGTTQSRISEIENGRRTISDALRVRIARALHTDPYALFPYEDGNGNGGQGAA